VFSKSTLVSISFSSKPCWPLLFSSLLINHPSQGW
jgi:hypothetical protein